VTPAWTTISLELVLTKRYDPQVIAPREGCQITIRGSAQPDAFAYSAAYALELDGKDWAG
jgi:hypothetical protein